MRNASVSNSRAAGFCASDVGSAAGVSAALWRAGASSATNRRIDDKTSSISALLTVSDIEFARKLLTATLAEHPARNNRLLLTQ
jgi:hypothetical protein